MLWRWIMAFPFCQAIRIEFLHFLPFSLFKLFSTLMPFRLQVVHNFCIYCIAFLQTFFHSSAMSSVVQNFCIYHITAPGQETGAEDLSDDYTYPSMEELSEQVSRWSWLWVDRFFKQFSSYPNYLLYLSLCIWLYSIYHACTYLHARSSCTYVS